MESQLQLEELRKAQRELNDAFSFRRSINTDETGDAFSTTATTPRPGEAAAEAATWDDEEDDPASPEEGGRTRGPARSRTLDRLSGESAHRPRRGQSTLAAALRPGPSGEQPRFRNPGHLADASRIARLVGGILC